MKTTKKIVNIGNCFGVIIDKPIAKKLKLHYGDLVEVDIKAAK